MGNIAERDSLDNKGRTIGLDVSLKAMVYEMYSQDLSKKISCVKEAQMNRGYMPAAAKVVCRIFTLACNGIKPAQIAVLLNSEMVLPTLSYRRMKYPDEA